MPEGDRVIINSGALACLDQFVTNMDPAGFILVNDYGPVRAEDVAAHFGVQRFGGSVALGLNFPLLEGVLAGRGLMKRHPRATSSGASIPGSSRTGSGRVRSRSSARDSVSRPTNIWMPRKRRRAPTLRPGDATKRSKPTAG